MAQHRYPSPHPTELTTPSQPSPPLGGGVGTGIPTPLLQTPLRTWRKVGRGIVLLVREERVLHAPETNEKIETFSSWEFLVRIEGEFSRARELVSSSWRIATPILRSRSVPIDSIRRQGSAWILRARLERGRDGDPASPSHRRRHPRQLELQEIEMHRRSCIRRSHEDRVREHGMRSLVEDRWSGRRDWCLADRTFRKRASRHVGRAHVR